jgi:hypothetical protein
MGGEGTVDLWDELERALARWALAPQPAGVDALCRTVAGAVRSIGALRFEGEAATQYRMRGWTAEAFHEARRLAIEKIASFVAKHPPLSADRRVLLAWARFRRGPGQYCPSVVQQLADHGEAL